VPPAPGAAPPADPAAPVPPAPEPAGGPVKRRRRGFLWFTLCLAVLVAVGAAGVVTLSTVFYIDVDQGRLTVYSGLPAEVGPMPLHAVYRRSDVEYSSLTPAQRQVVDERALRGRTDALALAAALGMQL
jgi:protein phosphatase